MRPYRGTLLASAILLGSLSLFGCGNALEGGSSPSGSWLTASVSESSIKADIFNKVCITDTDPDTGVVTYTYETGTDSGGPADKTVTVTIANGSTPNTPSGESTNSVVTMSRYRVDFVGTSREVSLNPIDGAQTVRIGKDSTGTMTVTAINVETLRAIAAKYGTIGNGEQLTMIGNITIWGEDSFHVTVSVKAAVTILVDDYGVCTSTK